MYEPDEKATAQAVRIGEAIRESLVNILAFDAAAAMRDLLAFAYNKQEERKNLATHK